MSDIIGILSLVIFVVVFGLVGLFITKRLGLLDKPGPDVPVRERVPFVQGIVLILGFFLGTRIFLPDFWHKTSFIALAGSCFILLIISVLDAFFGVKAKFRLLIQLIISVIVVLFGGLEFPVLEFGESIYQLPTILGIFFAVVWLMVFMNAINRFDGIYGLASGVSAVGFLTITLLINLVTFSFYPDLSLLKFQELSSLGMLSFFLFLRALFYTFIEFKPYGLLRDVGTMFLGLLLGYVALAGGAKIGTILVVLSLVIFDAIWVVINRVFVMKKNPTKGDYTHLHYRLMALGRTRTEVRVFVWLYSLVMMILMLLQGDNRIGKIVIFVLSFVIFFGVNAYLFWIKKLKYEYMKK